MKPRELGPATEPMAACQEAIANGLVVQRAHPLNCETPIPALVGGVIMPSNRFYIRNHFHIPALDAADFRLAVTGLVERPLSLGMHDLHAMPSHTLVATLECAGNGRTLFEPAIEGEKWNLGAVSTAEWTGVPLAAVLDRAGVRTGALEALFQGADGGPVEEVGHKAAVLDGYPAHFHTPEGQDDSRVGIPWILRIPLELKFLARAELNLRPHKSLAREPEG